MKVSRFVVVALLAMMLAVVGGGVMAQDGGGTVVQLLAWLAVTFSPLTLHRQKPAARLK